MILRADGAAVNYFPLFLDLRDRPVVVVGGGVVAERKIALLLAAGPTITVIARDLTRGLAEKVARGQLAHIASDYEPGMLTGQRLVIAATDDRETNRKVATEAQAAGILVNVVDDIEPSSCIVPAIVDRSPLIIAVSTGGSAPVLARDVRTRIETLIDESFGRLSSFLDVARAQIKHRLPDLRARRRFYERLLSGPLPGLIRRRREKEAAVALAGELDAVTATGGQVILVGAGPGDPGLLTLHAVRALQRADVVLYDRLVAPEILDYARREALRIEVGKSGSGNSTPQDAINALLVEHAATGATVVRLKGGDPFVFGRGGEELEHLLANGVPFEVVPGVTAATACAAYAGIPLTHRDHAASVRLVTGHRRALTPAPDLPGAHGEETLVIYMGVGMLADLQADLLAAGRAPSTPVAFIENGTRRDQRVITGTLGNADSIAVQHRLRAPSLIIVGHVASLASSLSWFGEPPIHVTDVPEPDSVASPAGHRQVA